MLHHRALQLSMRRRTCFFQTVKLPPRHANRSIQLQQQAPPLSTRLLLSPNSLLQQPLPQTDKSRSGQHIPFIHSFVGPPPSINSLTNSHPPLQTGGNATNLPHRRQLHPRRPTPPPPRLPPHHHLSTPNNLVPIGPQPNHRLHPQRRLLHFRCRIPCLPSFRLALGHRIACGCLRDMAVCSQDAGEDGVGSAVYLS